MPGINAFHVEKSKYLHPCVSGISALHLKKNPKYIKITLRSGYKRIAHLKIALRSGYKRIAPLKKLPYIPAINKFHLLKIAFHSGYKQIASFESCLASNYIF